jgi:hypothetical protein
MFRFATALLCFAIIVPAVPVLRAQATDASAAPLPSQITTAKKVFISNAGVGTAKTYNEFYAAIKSWGQYELVAAPADADLALEISLSPETGCESSRVKLVLLDTKTRIALWTFTESLQDAARQKTGDKNKRAAMNKLVEDLKSLTAQSASAAK